MITDFEIPYNDILTQKATNMGDLKVHGVTSECTRIDPWIR